MIPNISPLATAKLTLSKPLPPELLDRKQRLVPVRVDAITRLVQLLARHPEAKFALRLGGNVAFGDLEAVAHDDCLPTDGLALVELVRHEKDRHAFGMQAVNDANEVINFAPRQCGRRLIHNDQTGIGSDSASNGNELTRRDG